MKVSRRRKPDEIQIKDLLLRTIIGFNPEERVKRQDVLINITLYVDLKPAGYTDAVEDAVNYRTITKRIIKMVEASNFNLVERLASEAAALSLVDKRVNAVKVRIEKPGALRFARSVGVELLRTQEDLRAEPNRVYVTMGSNINPVENFQQALRLLGERCKIISVSPVYRTKPVGTSNQPEFLNAAVVVLSSLAASVLKRDVLLSIENDLNRVRVADKNAPRTIDLDIAMFNYDIMEVNGRNLPDPDLLKFAHIAVPLADIAPYYVHPVTEQSLLEIAASLSREGIEIEDKVVLDPVIS